jgi:catechol 2,3-dioxygenase-like lactoylglutathione lyase family enzyme
MIGRIHHVTLRVAGVADASARWRRLLGLTGDDGLLRCAYEDFCLELVEAGDARPGLEHVGWELRAGVTFDDARARLAAHAITPHAVEVPGGRGAGLRFDDPDGNGVLITERVVPADRTPAVTRFTDTLPAFHPRKLGHVNYLTRDVRRIVGFYEEVLGFRQTDWIGDEGCWMHVNADHHVLAFLEKGFAHIHHVAFELVDWGEFRVALDHLGQHGRNVVWGPGRHAMAQNLFAYWRMPEEDLFVELYADMEQLPDDHEVRYFPDDPHASNVWGTLPPRSYFRFDDEAIRSERDQLAALESPAGG